MNQNCVFTSTVARLYSFPAAEIFIIAVKSATSLCWHQEDQEVVLQTPEITQRVHHATDEEKLASTCMIGAPAESRKETEETKVKDAPMVKRPSDDTPARDGTSLHRRFLWE